MGDSDDDFDSRRNRDKFRRERDDFSGNRVNNNRVNGEWNDGRDRSNQFRRQYPNGPPQTKRIRRDWDNCDQTHKESSSDNTTQPPFLNFKNFLLNQDDNIDQEEAVKRYNNYKIDFKKTQILQFFIAHKDEEWFKYKYHPDEYPKRYDEQKQIIKKRLDIFMDLYNKGYLNNLSVDIENQHLLTRFLDAAIIKMEGGTDHDLRVLDIIKNETEADAPRSLHRTSSIFFRHLPMQTTKDELENICKQYDGFRRVCITDPVPERKFTRRGWVTFDHTVEIRNICYEFNSIKLHDVNINAVINREVKNRIRIINNISQYKIIVRNDIRLIIKLIKLFDERWNIWKSNEKNILITDDLDISSSTNKNSINYNPLLKNLTEYFIDEDDILTFEIDKELTKILDRLILYLRIVYSFDYYNTSEYTQEDSMPNRCNVIHVRDTSLSLITENELINFLKEFQIRLKPFIDFHEKLDDNEAIKLGAKNEQNEIEKFINNNCQEVGKDKWSCLLSGKKFKGPEFVRKHILNKHQDKLDDIKKEVIYFNNYLYDPKRPQLPEHPSNRPGATPTGPHPSGLPLPTPMPAQPLLTRPPLWPSGPPGYYPNQFHQPRHPRPLLMYQGTGGPFPRRPNNRQLRSYEDLDAPNEI